MSERELQHELATLTKEYFAINKIIRTYDNDLHPSQDKEWRRLLIIHSTIVNSLNYVRRQLKMQEI